MKGKFMIISGEVLEVEKMLNEMSKSSYVKVVATAVDSKVIYVTLYVKPLTTNKNGNRKQQ